MGRSLYRSRRRFEASLETLGCQSAVGKSWEAITGWKGIDGYDEDEQDASSSLDETLLVVKEKVGLVQTAFRQ
jgi:hypothetical protein